MKHRKKAAALAVACAVSGTWQGAAAQTTTPHRLEEVNVTDSRIEPAPVPAGKLNDPTLAPMRAGTSDTASPTATTAVSSAAANSALYCAFSL